jgi:hypothetical protein
MRIYLCALALLCALYYATGAGASPEMPFRDVNLKKTLKHPVESVESVVGNEHKRHKQNVLQAAQKVQDALHSNMQQLKVRGVLLYS